MRLVDNSVEEAISRYTAAIDPPSNFGGRIAVDYDQGIASVEGEVKVLLAIDPPAGAAAARALQS